MSLLIQAERLAADLASGAPLRLLDVRWRLNEPEGRPAYLRGHLPGAVFVDLERELSDPGRPERGRYPLPEPSRLSAAAQRWGISAGDRVVAYDDNDGVAAARAWWTLTGHGLDVRVLDGGFRAWVALGQELERGDRAVPPGQVAWGPTVAPTATIDDAALAPREGVLVDVRMPSHYRGQVGGADPVAGHIPGAINIPTITHIEPDGRLRPAAQIRETLRSHGITSGDRVVLYCSHGVASAHSALAFAHAGVPTRVFVGGWSQWSRTRGRAIARGSTPADVISAV
jgi:thiosulfate/3-mercaptopyruvate sulfurtransferase